MPLAAPIDPEYVVALERANADLMRENASLEGTNTDLAQANVRLERMLSQAQQLEANAVVNVRFTTSAITQGAAELYAYGTALSSKAMTQMCRSSDMGGNFEIDSVVSFLRVRCVLKRPERILNPIPYLGN